MLVWKLLSNSVAAITLVAMAIVPLFVLVTVLKPLLDRKFPRDSPLTSDLRRPPGHSLQSKIDTVSEHLNYSLFIFTTAGPLIFGIHCAQSYYNGTPESLGRTVVAIGSAVVFIGGAAWKIWNRGVELRKLLIGLNGELAVAQELDQLMLDGCRVFHDVPYQYGNIDHVVVSRSGVFAVNTKMRGKPKAGGDDNAKLVVDYNSMSLIFPDATIPIPVGSAETEQRWLSQYLTDSTGESVSAEALIAFPGWFIERRGQGRPMIINPKSPRKFFANSRTMHSDQQVQRIAHQLDQLVRDVTPVFQTERPRWESERA